MLLVVFPAVAAELPWECPAITVPADADVYRDTDAGLAEAVDTLQAEAMAWWDDGCAWVESTVVEGTITMTERVCEGTDRSVTWREGTDGSADFVVTAWELAVEPTGESWTRIELRWEEYDSTSSYGSDVTWTAAWEGAVDGLPDDGAFTWSDARSNDRTQLSVVRIDAGACEFQWLWSSDGEWTREEVGAPDHTVQVDSSFDIGCADAFDIASIDGTVVGGVIRETWERDPDDADGDGWVAGGCDCDDASADVNTDGREVVCDGVDQDCDGVDECDSGGGDTADTGADTGGADTGGAETGAGDGDTARADTAEPSDTAPADTGTHTGGSCFRSSHTDGGCAGGALWLALVPLLARRPGPAGTGGSRGGARRRRPSRL